MSAYLFALSEEPMVMFDCVGDFVSVSVSDFDCV